MKAAIKYRTQKVKLKIARAVIETKIQNKHDRKGRLRNVFVMSDLTGNSNRLGNLLVKKLPIVKISMIHHLYKPLFIISRFKLWQ